MKLIKYIRIMPEIGPHSVALVTAFLDRQVMVFTFFFFFITLALSLLLHISFGSGVEGYRSLGVSALTAFQSMLGKSR